MNPIPVWALLIPFFVPIQLGVSYYFSFSFAAFLFIVFIGKFPTIKDSTLFIIFIGLICFVVKSFSNLMVDGGVRETLIPIREMVCFLGLIIGSLKVRDSIRSSGALQVSAVSLILLILLVCLIQYFSLRSGQYFGFPSDWFIRNRATLEGASEALHHQTRFRPTAFYGEPSYAGFVIFSLMVISLCCGASARLKLFAFASSLVSSLALQSVSALISISLFGLLFLWIGGDTELRRYRRLAIILAALTIPIALVWNGELAGRALAIYAGSDESFSIRVHQPLSMLGSALAEGQFLGVTTQQIMDFYGLADGQTLMSNGLLWLLIYYGLLVIPILAALAKHAGAGLGLAYILISMNFNGDFFIYDKVVVMSVTLGSLLYYSFQVRDGLYLSSRIPQS